jgi:hypothetical protein
MMKLASNPVHRAWGKVKATKINKMLQDLGIIMRADENTA